MFDRAILLWIRFPCETFPAHAVEAQVEELDIAELIWSGERDSIEEMDKEEEECR
jgi:hypothetical protein